MHRSDLADDPMAQFGRWFAEWNTARPYEAEAVILATVDADGWPSARTVLMKAFDGRGFVFYTNRRSAKGRDLEASGRAAMCFLWQLLERQVRVVGATEHLPESESDAYFASRPKDAQIGAWASPQSAVINDRAELEQLVAASEARFIHTINTDDTNADHPGNSKDSTNADHPGNSKDSTNADRTGNGGPVLRPPHWGGYILRPLSVEFWQGRRSRRHDRLRYRRAVSDLELGASAEQSRWNVERLAP